MKAGLLLCYGLMLMLPLQVHGADLRLEIIPLQHRTTDEVIPVIRPLLGAGATVTGMNNQLIIKASADDIDMVRRLLLSLDTRPRRLLITVTHDVTEVTAAARQSLAGSVAAGDVEIAAGNAGRRGTGASVTLQQGDGDHARLQLNDSHSSVTDNNDMRVQALEGQPAFIESGSQVPLASRNAYRTRDGIVVQDTLEYHNATTGFYVIPRINGDTVTLAISPFMTNIDAAHPGAFKIDNIETTVRGRLGEWIAIGGYQQQQQRRGSGLFSQQQQQRKRQHDTYIKVEELP